MVKNNIYNSCGFTLIELLVVMSIISLLASVVFAQLNSARDKADNATVNATMRSILMAFKAYHLDHGYYPPTTSLDEAILANPVTGECEVNTWYGSYPLPGGVPSVNAFLVQYMGRIPTIPLILSGGGTECPIYHCLGDANPTDGCHGTASIGYALHRTNSTCLPGVNYPIGNDYLFGKIHVCGDYRP